jgi:hypothetical protein
VSANRKDLAAAIFDDSDYNISDLSGIENENVRTQVLRSCRCVPLGGRGQTADICGDFDLCKNCRFRRMIIGARRLVRPRPGSVSKRWKWMVVRVACRKRFAPDNSTEAWQAGSRMSVVVMQELTDLFVLKIYGTIYSWDIQWCPRSVPTQNTLYNYRPSPEGWIWNAVYLCKVDGNQSRAQFVRKARVLLSPFDVQLSVLSTGYRKHALISFGRMGRRRFTMPLLDVKPGLLSAAIESRPPKLTRFRTSGVFRHPIITQRDSATDNWGDEYRADLYEVLRHIRSLLSLPGITIKDVVDPDNEDLKQELLRSLGVDQQELDQLFTDRERFIAFMRKHVMSKHLAAAEELRQTARQVANSKRRKKVVADRHPDITRLDDLAYDFLNRNPNLRGLSYLVDIKDYEEPWKYVRALMLRDDMSELMAGHRPTA